MVEIDMADSDEEEKKEDVPEKEKDSDDDSDGEGGKKEHKGPDPHALLADGKKQKEIGFGAYKVEKYEKAIECWSMARGTMKHILDREFFKGNEEKIKETKDLETTLHLNLAQAYLKNKEFYQAINFCNKVLECEPNNVKALYRKASSHIMGSAFPEAKECLKTLLEVEPDNAGAKQLMVDIRLKEEAAKKTGKKAAKKMIGSFGGADIDHDPRIRAAELAAIEAEPDFTERMQDMAENVICYCLWGWFYHLKSLCSTGRKKKQ